MVKYEIVKENSEPDIKVLKLELKESKDFKGGIALIAYDDGGEDWQILCLTNEGKLVKYEGIGDDIGLDVDSEGYIEED